MHSSRHARHRPEAVLPPSAGRLARHPEAPARREEHPRDLPPTHQDGDHRHNHDHLPSDPAQEVLAAEEEALAAANEAAAEELGRGAFYVFGLFPLKGWIAPRLFPSRLRLLALELAPLGSQP